ncbi:hypothetical protein H0H93_010785 [Arthromyces matolae]|nr:hypothetical protein H0H93_010785 [Arthromyces matolae]
MAGETIMEYTYGLEIKPKNDPYVTTAFEAAHTLFTAAIPGAFLVDSLPILKYVPDWMPFADFKRKAKAWRKLAQDMVDKPFEAAKKNIENGDTTPSFVLSCLQDLNESKNPSSQELVVKATAGSMYTGEKWTRDFYPSDIETFYHFAAGSDTTVAAIASCILALLHNPSIIQKAREEIDRVVGPNRLPNFDDTESLPYVTAITKESLRWRDVAPIAVPHFLEDDDEYKGYRIPKGSIVVPNAWAMLHDETVYPQPFEFNPERFLKDGKLDPDVKDPDHAAFGFGRRICPGRHMAFSAIWITIASILATFDINKARDADGNIIEPLEKYSSAIVCIPAPYKCDIKPRSKQAVALINTAVHEDNWS